MLTLPIVFAAALLPLAFSADIPVFTLDCSKSTGYPGACETHCYAAACSKLHGGDQFRRVNKYLHFAKDSSTVKPNPATDVSEAKYRRQAIGCGGKNVCTDAGLSCDEFPYASTYDGGLGCFTSRFPGTKPKFATRGVIHCTSLQHNTDHGVDLGVFYRDQKLQNGDEFQIGFNEKNIDDAPACKQIREKGTAACAALKATNRFIVVDAPSTRSLCPDGPFTRRSLSRRLTEEDLSDEEPQELEWHSSVDAHGNKLLLPFADSPLKAGTPVFHGSGNGTTFSSTVI